MTNSDKDKKDKTFTIELNGHEVIFQERLQTGASILSAGQEQGAGVDASFVLSRERKNGSSKEIGPDDEVKLRKNLIFLAVPDDDNSRTINSPTETAIDHIRKNYPDAEIDVHEDGQGGAYIVLEDVPLGEVYVQDKTWVGFHIVSTCEYADTYPHYVRHDLQRADGRPLGAGMSQTAFAHPAGKRPAVQVSRRTNKKVLPTAKNPSLKLGKVLTWLNNQ